MLLRGRYLVFLSIAITQLIVISILLASNLNDDVCSPPKSKLGSKLLSFFINSGELSVERRTRTSQITTHISSNLVSSCVILIRDINGRLGNLLFLVASAYGLSRTHQCLLHIGEHILKELRETFELNLMNEMSQEDITLLEKQNISSQYSDCHFDPKLMRPEAVKYFELKGYWQAYGYFSQYMDEIRNLLSFKPNVVRTIIPFINSVLSNLQFNNSNASFKRVKESIRMTSSVIWIGIHIRRGDNLRKIAFDAGRTVPTVDFLNKAIAYFNRRYRNRTLFIIASDDKPYCRKTFQNRSNIIVTPDNFSPTADLAALALCTDVIATSGSFSWWAAVLAGGIVLHDEGTPRKNSTIEAICPRSSYYPPWFLFS
ncbi:unnamed protein product [Rotaria socialis]|uniref:L-Fucosyltransferase n=1 Tax=Rotaria socialis TaxID=392032 RepID=A0A820W0G3_9BILA|nr:unnamed protein product [Rotaria socialis]CAF3424131.1 unnamed protein product [Rotaria socialis]CAF4509316.1 unnamed protein product [Rotaria socialis]CAF4530926.1 unnamed protein product [Rotaria socialis]CAF4623560.1 unnamed protein product [Rotaria socialis]